jgi:hydroxyacylglutathione hydrolase
MLRFTFPVGLLQCNCTVLGDEAAGEAVVIDPGDDADKILALLSKHKLRAVAIVHTHAHIDHVGATHAVAKATGAKTYLHAGDEFLHQALGMQAMMLGLPEPESSPMDAGLDDLQSFRFGRHELGVLHTPGHTPGSVCFDLVGGDLCFSGDTLFNGSIGRTDLPGGDFPTIERSIRERLYTLNGAVQVIPGHGPATTIDRERASNPFVTALR